MRILSVDDDVQNLYLIEEVGRSHGDEVVSARNGIEALEVLNHQTIDLVISDVLMPEMDGFQLCHEMKSRERTRHIPFIFYTATYTARQDEELGLALGASRFIVKPMDPEQFVVVIETVIAEAQAQSASVPQVQLQGAAEYLRAYTARLVAKLDRKIAQLETAKTEYQALVEARDREITQRKRAEAERTGLEAQFLQSQKLESIGRLAGGVAHDFNNLLTIINGYADLALNKLPESDPLTASLREIRGAGERAAKLTRQLLAFSRRQVINPRPLNLTLALSEIRGITQRLLGDDVEVVTKLSDDVQPVLVDESQFHQVLLNLIVNARDAMPSGGRLTLETARVELTRSPFPGWEEFRPGQYASLSVTDTGLGIDEETLQHIFEPFFTTKGEGLGTGLGLSTVYGIVRQSGGWIRVESQPGRGSTFELYLPESATAADAIPSQPATDLPRGSETVLVVEDDASVRSLIAGVLRFSGYRVIEARGGEDALEAAQRHTGSIHLLVSDIQMPRMGGLELARRLQELRPSLRLLFLSGYLPSGPGPESELRPGATCMAKPFAAADLTARVRELLDSSKPSLPD